MTPLDRAMTRYAAGDDRAFDVIFAALGPRLVTFLQRLCGSEELDRDLAQDTFLRILRARASFARAAAALPWAFAIAKNCYLSHLRSWSSSLARASVDSEKYELSAGPETNAEQHVLTR